MKKLMNRLAGGLFGVCALAYTADAEDWTRFRGANGAGVSQETGISMKWSESENLKWSLDLPGAGSSSPIVSGDRIFVTCYAGEGRALVRHLVCVDRVNGEIAWSKTVPAEQPEDGYQGYLTEHGYASNTPVTDGEHLFVFFGKSGLMAFDLEGEMLWRVSVGTESSNRRWGSGSSLILYKNLVIVNASEESQSIRALDKETGKEIWKAEAASLELAYGTPTLVTLNDGRQELVIAVPQEVWGLDPDTGILNWYAETDLTGNVCPSIIADGEIVFAFGGYQSFGSLAIRAGGKGDVTESHVLWSSRNSSYVATPVLYKGRLYWVDDRGIAFCLDSTTGELVYKERLSGVDGGGRPFYASPILVDDKLLVVSRWNGTFVFAASPEFKLLEQNQLVSDESDFNATPAISHGEMYMRSDRRLYCIANDASER